MRDQRGSGREEGKKTVQKEKRQKKNGRRESEELGERQMGQHVCVTFKRKMWGIIVFVVYMIFFIMHHYIQYTRSLQKS